MEIWRHDWRVLYWVQKSVKKGGPELFLKKRVRFQTVCLRHSLVVKVQSCTILLLPFSIVYEWNVYFSMQASNANRSIYSFLDEKFWHGTVSKFSFWKIFNKRFEERHNFVNIRIPPNLMLILTAKIPSAWICQNFDSKILIVKPRLEVSHVHVFFSKINMLWVIMNLTSILLFFAQKLTCTNIFLIFKAWLKVRFPDFTSCIFF